MSCSRRAVLRAGGVGLLTFLVAGCERKMSAMQAREEAVPLRTLSQVEAGALEVLGDALLPGATASGLAQYIDQQLSGPAGESMLMLKYLGVAPPFAAFYKDGLVAFAAAARKQFDAEPQALPAASLDALIRQLAAGQVPDWQGPPAGLFYFVVRSDAIDVVYGTPQGFEKLGVPYMPHIPPASGWGA